MNISTFRDNTLNEVWAIKDALSAGFGHSLKATCLALYAEQAKHPHDFVNLGVQSRQNQALLATDGAAESLHESETAAAPHPCQS